MKCLVQTENPRIYEKKKKEGVPDQGDVVMLGNGKEVKDGRQGDYNSLFTAVVSIHLGATPVHL